MKSATRAWVASAVLILAAVGWNASAGPSTVAMTTAATQFLESLTPEQRKQATFEFSSDERTRWNYIPTETYPRNGLTIKQMTPAQRSLAHGLLKAGLSQRGYMTATQIMALESVLSAIEAEQGTSQFVRDPERYFFSIFGTPSPTGTWGWRVEGHHLSLHFTMANGSLAASSPTFMGSNPADVRSGPKKGTRVLAAEEDAGRALVESLDSAQRGRAIINTNSPNDMVTAARVKVDPLSPTGIAIGNLTSSQRLLLKNLIDVYAGKLAEDIAANRLARIDSAGWDHVSFAWAGSTVRGQKHYYRVQGPTFLIEYDNTQNDGNHIHSVWRDFYGDFGVDLLREHIKSVPHQ